MGLKLGFVVCLLLAHQRFLQNKGLVLLVLTSLLANLIIGFLHNFVPLPLVSITDAIGAIVVAILAVIWALVLLIFAIISIIKAIH
jgi:VanZ family protein